MQILYQTDVKQQTPKDIFVDFFGNDSTYMDETKKWAINLAKKTWESKELYDKLITKYAIG